MRYCGGGSSPRWRLATARERPCPDPRGGLGEAIEGQAMARVKVHEQRHRSGLARLDIHVPGSRYRLPDDWRVLLTFLGSSGPLAREELEWALPELGLPRERFGTGIPLPSLRLGRRRYERLVLVGVCIRTPGGRLEGSWDGKGTLRTVYHGAPGEAASLEGALKRVLRLVRRGRPLGTGTFRSRSHCLEALREAADVVRTRGEVPTQERVAQVLGEVGYIRPDVDSLNTLRQWLKRWGIAWSEVTGRP